ncbi:hypothetical protein OIU76_005469 [Salix suchowensis]|nr:hypothetical protein OIU76_005469 [Salix suchowensis]
METAKEGMLAKRKGVGAARFAAERKTISHPQKDATRVLAKRPRMNINTGDFSDSNIEGVQLPQTPTVERETLSSAINDTAIRDPCVEDRGTYGPCHGKSLSRNRKSKVGFRWGESKPGVGNEMMGFNDVMDKELLDPDGDSTLNDEGQNSGDRQSRVLSPHKTVDVFDSIGNLSSNGESGDWSSFSSISSSGFDDCGVDWSWDDVKGGHVEIGDETRGGNMLSWLWEEESQRLEDAVDCEKENAMLLGFFLDLPQ